MLKKIFIGVLALSISTAALQSEEKARGRVVYADVTGDLMHAGHISFFQKARAEGDYLIIGVLADEDVESYKRTPILSLKERVAVIKACKYVDEVIEAPPLRTTEEWLKKHNIDIVVHGDDMDEELLVDQYGVPMKMGIFKTVSYYKGISTTEIIQRIADRCVKKDQQYAAK